LLSLLRGLKNMSIIKAVLDSAWAHWRLAGLWAFSSVVGSFMPIWGAFFLLRLHRAPFLWVDFARHGEFGLYAAALLAPSIHQILKNRRNERFPLQTGSVLLALVGILMAAFIYAGTNPQLAVNAAQKLDQIDESYLMQVSGALLLIAFSFCFFVTLIDTSVNDPDLGVADKVNQAFLRAAVAVEQPESAPESDIPPQDQGDAPTTTNDDLRQRFNADRAQVNANGE